eukprot:6492784-Amphidinium_carterae.5
MCQDSGPYRDVLDLFTPNARTVPSVSGMEGIAQPANYTWGKSDQKVVCHFTWSSHRPKSPSAIASVENGSQISASGDALARLLPWGEQHLSCQQAKGEEGSTYRNFMSDMQ